jgi:Fic family protein
MNNFNRNQPYNDLQNLPPELNLETPALLKANIKASRLLAELKGYCETLPNPLLLLNTVILQESRDSAAIENIVTTQDELYKAVAETDEEKNLSSETKEVLLYRQALYSGLELMQNRGLTTNTIIAVMQKLKNTSTEVRKITGTKLHNPITQEVIYTPPEGEALIRDKLSNLEKFINSNEDIDPLIKMALIHYQFEAIHPFTDGNGRTGRILNVMFLMQQNLLTKPVLFLSSFIMKQKNDYYRLLREVTEKQNWHDWILYILEAVATTSAATLRKIEQIQKLKEEMTHLVKDALQDSYTKELVELIFSHPYIKIANLEKHKIVKRQTASIYLQKLTKADVLHQIKIGRENYFINHRLMAILSQDDRLETWKSTNS